MKELLANQFSNIYPGASEKFLASESWFYRFLRRYDFAMRRKTKIGQKLPAHLDIKLLEFQQFIIKKQKQFEYELSEIGNMDETPVYFDMVGNLTIDKHGAKTVQVQTTGNDKNRFTCVLTILADGTKLPPIVIFKGKQMPKNLPSQIIVLMHPKGWMDEIGMKAWFDKRIRNYYTSLHEFVTSVLDQIKQYTKVVADTGYFESTQKPNYAHHFTIYSTYLLYRSIDKKVELATDKLLINFDNEILKIIPGRVSTEVDAILSFDTEGTIAKANCLIGLYEEAGIVACAEAGVTLVSPFVDRILDWYKKNTGQDFSAKEDPGSKIVRTITF
ncbi:11424_t:CDS:2 [Entrophospora sp. SA101]|nr:11424_t:CDS:2 [Entrophospora sp. SA101]